MGKAWLAVLGGLAVGCGGSSGSGGPEPYAAAQAPLGPDGGAAVDAAPAPSSDAAPVDAAPCIHPRSSPYGPDGGDSTGWVGNDGCLVDGLLPIGHPCTPGQDDLCEPSSYVGPLTLSWGCYLTPGTASDYRCAFRCDDVSGVPLVDVDAAVCSGLLPVSAQVPCLVPGERVCDPFVGLDAQPPCSPSRFPADAQVNADQPASIPPICAQLGGTCMASPGLPATNGRPGALFWGAPAVCVVAP